MREKLPPFSEIIPLFFGGDEQDADVEKPKDCVLELSPFGDYWTIKDSFEGTCIFGSIGSGKTSGSGNAIARSFLKAGFGGLVLTAKVDETKLWEEMAKSCGRESDLIIVSPKNYHRFNFMEYETSRPGDGAGLTENLVMLFLTVMEIGAKKNSKGAEDFWKFALRELLVNTIDLLQIANLPVNIENIHEIIHSSPSDILEALSPQWVETSFCGQVLLKVQETNLTTKGWNRVSHYFLRALPRLSDKTRSIVFNSFSAMAALYRSGVLCELFCTDTNYTPEVCWVENKIVVLDLNIKEFGEIGQYGQVMFKYIFQKAIERRNIRKYPNPVFLWADEVQNFISSYDTLFQSTARSSRVATVYLTQNLPGMYNAAGGESGRHEIDSLIGNLTTKIFHSNSDVVTNKFAADLISKSIQMKAGFSKGNDEKGHERMNINLTPTLDYQVQPIEFLSLKKGGEENEGKVQAILFQSGREWNANGKNFIKVKFTQTGF